MRCKKYCTKTFYNPYYSPMLRVKFFNPQNSHEGEWIVAEQAGREKDWKGTMNHVLI